MASPSSSRKSYPAAFKLSVVNYSEAINEETGVENGNRAAARRFNVDESMVRRWRNDKIVLKALPTRKRASRGKQPKWPELEKKLKNWIVAERALKRKVAFTHFRV